MANKITATTLKKGAAALGLEVGDLKKKKELETLIDNHLEDQELGYECPECGKDIPDIDECPYCGESFTDAEDAENEDAEETEEESDDLPESIEEEVEEEKPAKGKGKDKAKGKGKTKEVEVEDEDEEEEEEEKPAKSKSKGKDKEKVKEEKTEKEKSANRGRPSGKSQNTEEKEKEFVDLISQIDDLLGEDYEKRERKTGVTYVKDKKRLLKAVSTGKTLSIEFNVDLKSENENLKKYTAEEAKERHLGSTRAIYALGDIVLAVKLVKEALKAK